MRRGNKAEEEVVSIVSGKLSAMKLKVWSNIFLYSVHLYDF